MKRFCKLWLFCSLSTVLTSQQMLLGPAWCALFCGAHVRLSTAQGCCPGMRRKLPGGAQVLGTPTREDIHAMNPNYTEFKFPHIKAHPWSKVFSKRLPADAVDLVSTQAFQTAAIPCMQKSVWILQAFGL